MPEIRVYIFPNREDIFIRDFIRFAYGRLMSDTGAAGLEIGRPVEHYRRVHIESRFGKMLVLVTDEPLALSLRARTMLRWRPKPPA